MKITESPSSVIFRAPTGLGLLACTVALGCFDLLLSATLFVLGLDALTIGAGRCFLLRRGESRPHGLNSPPTARRWLTRPFSPRALVTAVAELTRPAPGRGAAGAADGGADHGRHEIRVNGRDVSLTRTEYALVTALAGQTGRVLSRQRLLAALESERGKRPSPRAVDVYIAQLRAKLGDGAIRTVHGVGYVLDPETTA